MLATKGDHVPTGAEWIHEVKWDGMRVLVDRTPDRLRIWSRNENDVTVSFPELRGLADVADDVLLDGEVVALGEGDPDVRCARRTGCTCATRPGRGGWRSATR